MMPSPGALYLRFRLWSQHGLVTAYYRDLVRPRILAAPCFSDTVAPHCEIHALTSSSDWLNLVWALRSFYRFAGVNYRLCIHDDGTLPTAAFPHLRRHFPQARVIARPQADAVVERLLAGYPRCLAFRKENHLALKLFDTLAFAQSERLLVFDSDLLFFRRPAALIKLLEDPSFHRNVFNADFDSAYTVSPDLVESRLGFRLQERINSGLGLVHRASLRLDWIEEFLGLPGIREGHFWRIEQTLFALCSSRWGVELLPEPDYTLSLEPGINGRPFRHYVGAIRHLFYREGIRHLVRTGFLKQLRRPTS